MTTFTCHPLRLLCAAALATSATAQFELSTDVGFGMDDAEITHDGKYAIVRENKLATEFRIYDLSTGALVGSPVCPSGTSGASQDAIALSDTRAVLLGSCAVILDLTALPTIQVVASYPLGLFARDVVITPDGTIAAVRGGSGPNGGLFLFDTAGGALLAKAPGQPTDPNSGSYSFDVDSVVANDDYALFLSLTGTTAAPRARVTIFDLHPAAGGAPAVAFETQISGPQMDLVGAPHDVALSPDRSFAAVRAESSVALFDLSGATPTMAWHRRLWEDAGPFENNPMDSIEVSDERIATISLWPAGLDGTQVDVFDKAGNGCHDLISGRPHDLTLTPSGERLVGRTAAGVYLYAVDALPAGNVLTPLDTHFAPSTHSSFTAGLDSVLATEARAVTMSRVLETTEVRIFDIGADTLELRALHVMPNRPVDLDLSPDGNLVGVTGTDHVMVLDLRTDAVIYSDPVVSGLGYFPWCDGVALDNEHLIGFGYTASQSGWVQVVDLFQQPTGYCTAAPNSVGPGALLHVTGSASLAANDLVLWGTGLPPGTLGVFAYGDGQANLPFGNGFLCLSGVTQPFAPVLADDQGVATVAVDVGGPASTGGLISAGSTWNFQL
ncbi:MAG TPA: hypothetical protein VMT18_05555, partial [Planctomycetota bacterium]|nr:hypothetical protein [Planctomycetota bacterium]